MSQIDAPAKEIARIHGTGSMRNSCWKKRRSAKAWRTCEPSHLWRTGKSGANWSFWGATFPFAAANSVLHEAEDTFRPRVNRLG